MPISRDLYIKKKKKEKKSLNFRYNLKVLYYFFTNLGEKKLGPPLKHIRKRPFGLNFWQQIGYHKTGTN